MSEIWKVNFSLEIDGQANTRQQDARLSLAYISKKAPELAKLLYAVRQNYSGYFYTVSIYSPSCHLAGTPQGRSTG